MYVGKLKLIYAEGMVGNLDIHGFVHEKCIGVKFRIRYTKVGKSKVPYSRSVLWQKY